MDGFTEYSYELKPEYKQNLYIIDELLEVMSLNFTFNNNQSAIIVKKGGNVWWEGSYEKDEWIYYCFAVSKCSGIDIDENFKLNIGYYKKDFDLLKKLVSKIKKIEMDDRLTKAEGKKLVVNDFKFKKKIKNYDWMKIVNFLSEKKLVKYIERDTDYYAGDADIRVTFIDGTYYSPGLCLTSFSNGTNLSKEGQMLIDLLLN